MEDYARLICKSLNRNRLFQMERIDEITLYDGIKWDVIIYKENVFSSWMIALVSQNEVLITNCKYNKNNYLSKCRDFLQQRCNQSEKEMIENITQQIELLNRIISSNISLEKIIMLFKQYCYSYYSKPLIFFQCLENDMLIQLNFCQNLKISQRNHYQIMLQLSYNKIEDIDLSTNKIFSDEINEDIFDYFLKSNIYLKCNNNKLVKHEIRIIKG
ncbi:MAG: hypothetical protein PUE66_04445 [Erysipelotrichaceae bacterium]|nr:hypothetical protein [Erysipelotrichaceae bacterium]